MQALGVPERLIPSAVSTFGTVDNAQKWVDAAGRLALRSEYLREIAVSKIQPHDFARLREVGLTAMNALRLPKRLATAGLGVDDIVSWYSAKLGPRLEDLLPYLGAGLIFGEVMSIVAERATVSDIQPTQKVDELLEVLESGLSIGELRQLTARGLDLYQIYTWRKACVPVDDWNEWISHGTAAEAAGIYVASGVSPTIASEWIKSGIRALDAVAFLGKGVRLEVAAAWHEAGFSGRDAMAFIDRGMSLTDAQRWTAVGLSAIDAVAFIDGQLSLTAAQEWAQTGLPAPTAMGFHDKGVSPAEAAEFDRRGIEPDQITRTDDGLEFDLEQWQEDPLDQLPSVIEPGHISFTLWSSALGGERVAYDVSFTWDGERAAEWYEDISMVNDDLSPASSSPVWGVAGWPDGRDVELTYQWSDLGMLGHDRLPGVAPTKDDPESNAGAKDPRRWVDFGTAIVEFALTDIGSGGGDRGEWSAEYYDSVLDTVIDFHDVFRRYLLEAATSHEGRSEFDEWFVAAARAGKYEEVDG
jgi:hypothetical protein